MQSSIKKDYYYGSESSVFCMVPVCPKLFFEVPPVGFVVEIRTYRRANARLSARQDEV